MSQFTTQELDLASDPTVLLIKYRMLEKVRFFFEEMQQEIKNEIAPFKNYIPSFLDVNFGKISRGENYKHLPYVISDFPAYFSRKDIFAFRTMFYWGHFLSGTFHLQGSFLEKYGEELISVLKNIEGVYFGVNESPWEYHYKSSNYCLINEFDDRIISEHMKNFGFIKLSIKFPVEDMVKAKSSLITFLIKGLKVIRTN